MALFTRLASSIPTRMTAASSLSSKATRGSTLSRARRPFLPLADAATLHTCRAAASFGAAPSAPRPIEQACDVNLTLRPASTRGHGDHGWLNAWHTFSFGSWRSAKYQRLNALRVINEDRVKEGTGFDTHPHAEFEIFSYIVRGTLLHRDSMGNEERLPRGSIQHTSAGTGMTHSEHNASSIAGDFVHLLQMWIKPNKSGLPPAYFTRSFSDEQKLNCLRLILSEDGREGSIPIRQDVSVYASILSPGASVTFDVAAGREVYVHLVMDCDGFQSERNQTAMHVRTSSGAQSIKLTSGDAVLVQHSSASEEGAPPQTVTFTGAGANGANAEFILFNLLKV